MNASPPGRKKRAADLSDAPLDGKLDSSDSTTTATKTQAALRTATEDLLQVFREYLEFEAERGTR